MRDVDASISIQQKGFTLLELLIVLGIIVVLSAMTILIVNPSEILKKARDDQRLSDLQSLKKTIDMYLVSIPGQYFYTGTDILGQCLETNASNTGIISYSYSDGLMGPCAGDVIEGADVTTGATFHPNAFCANITPLAATRDMSAGWVTMTYSDQYPGSGKLPISALPLDPVNSVSNVLAPSSSDLTFRFTCQGKTTDSKPEFIYELNAVLESVAYTSTDNKMEKDGGDNNNYYETGSNLKLLGAGTNY